LVEILVDSARALPVSQEVQHGPEESRSAAFNEAEQEAYARSYRGFEGVLSLADLHHHAGVGSEVGMRPWVFQDRRREGRRYRQTWEGDPDIPQASNRISGWQRDLPKEAFERGW
jgi:hypothetical protein